MAAGTGNLPRMFNIPVVQNESYSHCYRFTGRTSWRVIYLQNMDLAQVLETTCLDIDLTILSQQDSTEVDLNVESLPENLVNS